MGEIEPSEPDASKTAGHLDNFIKLLRNGRKWDQVPAHVSYAIGPKRKRVIDPVLNIVKAARAGGLDVLVDDCLVLAEALTSPGLTRDCRSACARADWNLATPWERRSRELTRPS